MQIGELRRYKAGDFQSVALSFVHVGQHRDGSPLVDPGNLRVASLLDYVGHFGEGDLLAPGRIELDPLHVEPAPARRLWVLDENLNIFPGELNLARLRPTKPVAHLARNRLDRKPQGPGLGLGVNFELGLSQLERVTDISHPRYGS